MSYTIDERKSLFYHKILSNKNVMLRLTLTCLPGVFSDYMFLCRKYDVRPILQPCSIKDAVIRTVMVSSAAC